METQPVSAESVLSQIATLIGEAAVVKKKPVAPASLRTKATEQFFSEEVIARARAAMETHYGNRTAASKATGIPREVIVAMLLDDRMSDCPRATRGRPAMRR
jgi:hypothetical protein